MFQINIVCYYAIANNLSAVFVQRNDGFVQKMQKRRVLFEFDPDPQQVK